MNHLLPVLSALTALLMIPSADAGCLFCRKADSCDTCQTSSAMPTCASPAPTCSCAAPVTCAAPATCAAPVTCAAPASCAAPAMGCACQATAACCGGLGFGWAGAASAGGMYALQSAGVAGGYTGYEGLPNMDGGGVHGRYPYHSYRRPWAHPGPRSTNINIVW